MAAVDHLCLAAQEHIEVVKQDFRLIFKDIMDKDHFESNIYFRDPMTTNLNSFRGGRRCQLLAPCCQLGVSWLTTRKCDTAVAHATHRCARLHPETKCDPGLPCPAGYQFVCQFLRYFLAPIFELHEVRQAGEQEILVKWSWTMNFWCASGPPPHAPGSAKDRWCSSG